jgi:hypothetical protein
MSYGDTSVACSQVNKTETASISFVRQEAGEETSNQKYCTQANLATHCNAFHTRTIKDTFFTLRMVLCVSVC